MTTLSVAIVARNEEANLARTLASVAWADEIVVVDAFSTDRTAVIAREFGAHVIERVWSGFAEQKNFALAQCTSAWVLSLDADEELTPELQQQMRTVLASDTRWDAFYLKRRNLFLGRWMQHGGFYPDKKLRLFRRMANEFRSPRFIDRPVHEVIEHTGSTATLDFDLVHHAYPTLTTYLEHMERYSTLGADVLVTKGRISRSLPAFIGNVVVGPVFGWVKNYVFRLGFLDGREGLLLHSYQAVYASWKHAKAWERARR